MTAAQRQHVRQVRNAHVRTRQLGGTKPAQPGHRDDPNRWTHRPKWGHCTYCGHGHERRRVRGIACQKHRPLLQLDIGEARG